MSAALPPPPEPTRGQAFLFAAVHGFALLGFINFICDGARLISQLLGH